EAALIALPSSHPAAAQTLPPSPSAQIFAVASLGARCLAFPPTAPRLRIANDTALLAAPLPEAAARLSTVRTCVGAVGGTGSVAASFRLPDAEEVEVVGYAPQELARVGGWGWILGDEGGGFHVGREAIRHLLRAHELAVLRGVSNPGQLVDHPDSLRARVLAHFGVASVHELLTLLHDPDPLETIGDAGTTALPAHRLITREKRLSQLSPLVFRAAFGGLEGSGSFVGDPLALSVLRATAAELAEQIALLLSPPSSGSGSSPSSGSGSSPSSSDLRVPAVTSLLVLGGSLVGVPAYRTLVLDALAERGHVFACVEYVADAAEAGARGLVAQFASKRLD
ncbi:hypothetical protein EW145_g4496, partial [Phellinidium pouzarii]